MWKTQFIMCSDSAWWFASKNSGHMGDKQKELLEDIGFAGIDYGYVFIHLSIFKLR